MSITSESKQPKHNGPWAKPVKDRIRANVLIDEHGCWRWQRYVRPNGYGQIGIPGTNPKYVHRVAYEQWVGPIPNGLQIDHLCRVRDCCNPTHLEAVPCRENLVRGTGFVARNVAATHCPQGHAYDEVNTYIRPGNGDRDCKTCRSESSSRASAKRKAARWAAKAMQAEVA